MSEKDFEVKTLKVHYICDECGKGELLPTGTCFPTNPPMYPHLCSNTSCNSGRTFNIQYPTIKYTEVGI